jgi:hypothetical protein
MKKTELIIRQAVARCYEKVMVESVHVYYKRSGCLYLFPLFFDK